MQKVALTIQRTPDLWWVPTLGSWQERREGCSFYPLINSHIEASYGHPTTTEGRDPRGSQIGWG
ncbi:MAG: hypothetical protein JWR80_1401 [Bradyrhizobium sp.]|nr:hypothetical protein [Bradyrhizobium sp.]